MKIQKNNIVHFPVEPIMPLRKFSGGDKIIAGYFDESGLFNVYIGEMSYMEKLFAVDTISKTISKDNQQHREDG